MHTPPIAVLIVDDQPSFRRAAADVVAATPDFAVAGECADGEAAVERCRHGDIDLVLLDLNMPAPDGLETAARLRLSAPSVQIVFVSTYAAGDVPADVHAAGHPYLQKSRLTPTVLADVWRARTSGPV